MYLNPSSYNTFVDVCPLLVDLNYYTGRLVMTLVTCVYPAW